MNTHYFYSPERSSSLGRTSRRLLRFFAWAVLLWPALLRAQNPPTLTSVNANFGTVSVNGAGTAILSNAGGFTGSAQIVNSGGTHLALQVSMIARAGGGPWVVTTGTIPASLSLGGGMTVTGIAATQTPNPINIGTVTISWGGTLNTTVVPVAGLYSGSFNLQITDTGNGGKTSLPHTCTFSVTVATPLTLTQLRALNFGTIAPQLSGGGTCVISPAGVRSQTGGVQLITSGPGTSAQVRANGTPSATFTLNFTNGTLTGPGANITVNTFTLSAGFVGLQGTLDGAGANTFTVGATATINASQVAGTYSGSFTITATYP